MTNRKVKEGKEISKDWPNILTKIGLVETQNVKAENNIKEENNIKRRKSSRIISAERS